MVIISTSATKINSSNWKLFSLSSNYHQVEMAGNHTYEANSKLTIAKHDEQNNDDVNVDPVTLPTRTLITESYHNTNSEILFPTLINHCEQSNEYQQPSVANLYRHSQYSPLIITQASNSSSNQLYISPFTTTNAPIVNMPSVISSIGTPLQYHRGSSAESLLKLKTGSKFFTQHDNVKIKISKSQLNKRDNCSAINKNWNYSNDHCKVCGDTPIGKNFGVVTCGSCKIFFSRNIDSKERLKCRNHNRCMETINKSNRRNCSACRLDKCIRLGMRVKRNRQKQTLNEKNRTTSPACVVLELPASSSNGLVSVNESRTLSFEGNKRKSTDNNEDYNNNENDAIYQDLPSLVSIDNIPQIAAKKGHFESYETRHEDCEYLQQSSSSSLPTKNNQSTVTQKPLLFNIVPVIQKAPPSKPSPASNEEKNKESVILNDEECKKIVHFKGKHSQHLSKKNDNSTIMPYFHCPSTSNELVPYQNSNDFYLNDCRPFKLIHSSERGRLMKWAQTTDDKHDDNYEYDSHYDYSYNLPNSSSSVELCKAEAKNFGDQEHALIAELDKWKSYIRIKFGLDYNLIQTTCNNQLLAKEKEKIDNLNLSCRMISAKLHSPNQCRAITCDLERGIFYANKSFKLYEDFWSETEISDLIRQNETGFNRKKNNLLHMLYHLRGVQNFDENLNAWAIFNGTNDNGFIMVKLEMFLQSIKKEMGNTHLQYITSFPKEWRLDPTIFNMMTYLLLFDAFDRPYSPFKSEKLTYFQYLYLLMRYFECMYQNVDKAQQMLLWMLKLIRKLTPICSECLTACTHSLNPAVLKKIGPNYAQCLMMEEKQKKNKQACIESMDSQHQNEDIITLQAHNHIFHENNVNN